ncbi:ABC transporter permease [Halorhabdus salina]|uniref:ABC transporter permease n=1 Tax=Halorhabdus salina TaxID=2750670 RepID=UPI0015EFAD88
MVNYYIKRTGQMVVTLYAVVTIAFGLVRFLPGGPATALRAQLMQDDVPSEVIAQRIELYLSVNPDAPLLDQYISYMSNIFLNGSLGKSVFIQRQTPVTEILAEALPWTLFIVISSIILFHIMAVVIGALMAYWEGSLFDTVNSAIAIVFTSIPFYVLAIVLVWILGYEMSLFPVGNRYGDAIDPGLSVTYILDVIYHGALPIASMVITQYGVRALSFRGNSIQILGEDFVRVARLRGLSDSRIALWYVGRNAILPLYTGFLLSLGWLLGGTVILEEIFNYPGIGLKFIEALEVRDYPVIMGVFIMITVALVVGIYIADLTYGKIDPRIETGDQSEAF